MAVTLILGITFAAIRLFSDGDYFTALIAMGAGAGIGYMLPDRFLEYAVRARSMRLLMGIPAAIDLLVLSLEAGQNLDSALVDTARELNAEYPDLSAEFNLVQMELLASLSRPEVFRSLRDRNQEPELKRLAQVFIDSDRFGTSAGSSFAQPRQIPPHTPAPAGLRTGAQSQCEAGIPGVLPDLSVSDTGHPGSRGIANLHPPGGTDQIAPQAATSASTRHGLPEPFTIFNGGVIRSEPLGGNWSRFVKLANPNLLLPCIME